MKLEEFWTISGGSGVYLGNFEKYEGMHGYHYRPYGVHIDQTSMSSVILTNAHVAKNAMAVEIHVNKAKDTMWVVMPGVPFVRYTSSSDRLGSPAAVLILDGVPVISAGVDAALMVTTPIAGYREFADPLGDSDMVSVGDDIISV